MSSASDSYRVIRQRAMIAALAICAALAMGASAPGSALARSTLRVCADPNNLPFSNARGEGFENRLAALVASELGGKKVVYTFFPQRRGFIRNTLRAGTCDVVMGVPAAFEMVRPTTPYYRSSYVFVTRKDAGAPISSFDDPRLRTLRIGIHVIGDDYNNVPPAEALATRHIVDNVRGYPIYGAYSEPDPPRALVDAVARREIDVAIAWGPLAGYFARREPVPLVVTRVSPAPAVGPLAMVFDISMGVRRDDEALRAALERVLEKRRPDVRRLLESYGVPLLETPNSKENVR
jgi:mxaJ protein